MICPGLAVSVQEVWGQFLFEFRIRFLEEFFGNLHLSNINLFNKITFCFHGSINTISTLSLSKQELGKQNSEITSFGENAN